MTMYSIVESEEWMLTGEVRCGCVGVVVNMHTVQPEIHECSACGATWLSGDGRIAYQYDDTKKLSQAVVADVPGTVSITETNGEWAVTK